MKPCRNFQHPLPGRRINTICPAQGPRSRRDRYAGRRGNVAKFSDRRSGSRLILQSFPIIRSELKACQYRQP